MSMRLCDLQFLFIAHYMQISDVSQSKVHIIMSSTVCRLILQCYNGCTAFSWVDVSLTSGGRLAPHSSSSFFVKKIEV